MHRLLTTLSVIALSATTAFAQPPAATTAAPAAKKPAATAAKAKKEPLVEFEMMTWPEVRDAMAAGKTTALVYTGGTEQRGPQNVNGGHTLMGRATVKAIALRLGNAIAMPVLPYTPNNASATLPGTIGLTPELLGAVLERVVEQSMQTGFKNVVIMGDHGGGQPDTYAAVAKKEDAKYAPEGRHVYFCDEVYAKAQGDFDDWLAANGYPRSSHAGIPDTSTMLYLGRRGLHAQGADPDGGGRSDRAARRAGTGPRPRRRSERAAAQEQRHHRRRTPLDGRARQESVRHEGRLRRETDSRIHPANTEGIAAIDTPFRKSRNRS